MKSRFFWLALALLILFAAGGCNFFGTHEGVEPPECLQDERGCVEDCSDEDTDMDGLFECDDPDCAFEPWCQGEGPGEDEYDGPPEGLVAGTTWQEERDGLGAEVHSGFTIVDFGVVPKVLHARCLQFFFKI